MKKKRKIVRPQNRELATAATPSLPTSFSQGDRLELQRADVSLDREIGEGEVYIMDGIVLFYVFWKKRFSHAHLMQRLF